jgi:hypothetical protein
VAKSTGSGPGRFVMIRDSLLLAGGLLGIGFQQITGKTDPLLIGVYMTMLGLPGVAGVISLVRSSGPSSQSSAPSPPSPLPSSPYKEPIADDRSPTT